MEEKRIVQQADTSLRGRNVLREEEKKSVLACFGEQLNDPLIYILFVAAAVSLLLKEVSDTVIILTVIVMNSIIGVIQEGKAQKALDALKKMTSPKALVKKNGEITEIPAADLVPGDMVCLEAGRQVPADLELTEAVNLKIEEAALTGESVPVCKDTKKENKAYMSTNVTYGRGEGVVRAIGMDTEIGKIAGMLQNTKEEETPLQKRLADIGKVLSGVSVFLCVLLFLIAVLQKRDLMEMLITAISLAVAAVPEGLPAIVTMVLALSVTRMVKVNTIVKRLPSVETLGCVSVVCSDKTGTLTQNKMTVVRCFTEGKIYPADALDPVNNKEFLYGFTLCNDGEIAGGERIGDPTELALLDMAKKYGVTRKNLEKELPRVDELAFDSQRKRMTTFHQSRQGFVSYTKGSPEEVLKNCKFVRLGGKVVPMSPVYRQQIEQAIKDFTKDALRVLVLGMRTDEKRLSEENLVFAGMVGMADPVRPEAAAAVREFCQAGVKTVMITGDRSDTAFAIAKELGIAGSPKECLSGEEMQEMSDAEFQKRLPGIRVFAHVSPEHKVRIVKGFKENGQIVAMTGDGVNDAPSLKMADVGIAMGLGGTDVAKNAADIVLTDDNFATIAGAIAQGRSIYENIKKSVLFLLSSNFGEIITMLAAILTGLASPLKPAHILWINLITDSLPALALGVDMNENENFMKRPPRAKKESLFAGGGLKCTLFYGCLIAVISTTAFLQLPISILRAGGSEMSIEGIRTLLTEQAVLSRSQTYAFTVLGLSQLFHAIGMRDVETSVFRMKHFENKLMIAAFAVGIVLQLMVTEIPYFITMFGTCSLSLQEWGMLVLLAAMPVFAHEVMLLSTVRVSKKLNESENY